MHLREARQRQARRVDARRAVEQEAMPRGDLFVPVELHQTSQRIHVVLRALESCAASKPSSWGLAVRCAEVPAITATG